jgi:hypothetical protein
METLMKRVAALVWICVGSVAVAAPIDRQALVGGTIRT